MVSVIILLTGRSWTSVQCNELDDHLINDGSLNGPTYVALDSMPLTQDDFQLFTYLNARQIGDKIWQSKDTPATLIAKLYRYRFRLIGTASSGCGFSGIYHFSSSGCTI